MKLFWNNHASENCKRRPGINVNEEKIREEIRNDERQVADGIAKIKTLAAAIFSNAAAGRINDGSVHDTPETVKDVCQEAVDYARAFCVLVLKIRTPSANPPAPVKPLEDEEGPS